MDDETVTAICAVIIALSALVVSIWEGIQNRKHNRLSVRPHLRIDRSTYVGSPAKITIGNNGLGTAIVQSFTVHCDGNRVTARVTADDVPLAVAAVKRLGNL